MNRFTRVALLASSLSLVTTWGLFEAARGDDNVRLRDIPPAFAPFEYLLGGWKGQGIPKDKGANQFRGWTETHSWAWIFVKGKPAGLSVTIEGGKVLAGGKLSYDLARKRYHLEATEPKPLEGRIVFEGTLDESGKLLVLERTSATGKSARDSGKLRLSLRPNANFIRYTMTADRQEPGEFQFSRIIEVGVTKDGESLAGSSTAAERPKCIVTGGAATMTVSYQDRTFPICCTGCRDEFNDNPEKHIKKAALMLSSEGAKPKSNQPAPSRVNRFEDAFAGDVPDSGEAPSPSGKGQMPSPATTKKPGNADAGPATTPADTRAQTKPIAKKDTARSAASKQATRAATLLRLGQSLEKTGKTTAALSYFRQIVKDFPATPAAKTAAERIKALDGG